ncbi:MAG TPA: hypothetical protein ENK60_09285 [Anaerolineae bacterium]|nr:hypothetical protein [Anaerolineae bacterium]
MTQLQRNRPVYRHTSPADAWTPVLVAVVNNEKDLQRALKEHWYRIPVKRAPRQIAAEYLALYQTGKFGAQGRRINIYAPILRYHIVTRRELIPDEPDHPRAHDQYFKLELGDFIPLKTPITNKRHPRLTFLITTLERLLQAQDVSDLWLREAARKKLYTAVRERGLAVECWYPVDMGDRPEADLALFGPDGRIHLYIEEPEDWVFDEPGPVWENQRVVRVNALEVLRDAADVLRQMWE